MRIVLATGLAIGIVAAAVAGQAPAQQPGPQHARLAAFAGQWNYTGEAKSSPLGPAGKVTSSETCEWFDGEFHLVCRARGTGPRGQVTGMSVMGYDSARQAYTYHAITSLGDNVYIRGKVDGKVWTWSDETTMDGKAVKILVTVTEQTPSTYGVRVEASMDNAPMMLVEEGTSTRQP